MGGISVSCNLRVYHKFFPYGAVSRSNFIEPAKLSKWAARGELICRVTSRPSYFQWKRNEPVNQHYCRWISGDRAKPRRFLERRFLPTALAVSRSQMVPAGAARTTRSDEYRYLSIILMVVPGPWLPRSAMSYGRGRIEVASERDEWSPSRSSWYTTTALTALSPPLIFTFRNTVTCESCRKLTDWNSASRYNGYSSPIESPDRPRSNARARTCGCVADANRSARVFSSSSSFPSLPAVPRATSPSRRIPIAKIMRISIMRNALLKRVAHSDVRTSIDGRDSTTLSHPDGITSNEHREEGRFH